MPKITSKLRKIQRGQEAGDFSARKEAEKDENKVDYSKIIQQVEQEFQLCYQADQAKKLRDLGRLKIYNNQAKDPTKVGYPLVYGIHQVVHANLYDDKLQVTCKPREEGDSDQADNLTQLFGFDYGIMKKDQIDEAWNFDAELFGNGYVLLNNFDLKLKTPTASVIDPTVLMKDPMAVSVAGDMEGNGAWRFGGYEVYMTKYAMEKNPSYFNLDSLKFGNDELTSFTAQARRERAKAQGRTILTNWENLTENYNYGILRWFTHIDGEKYLVELGNNRTEVVRCQRMEWDTAIIQRKFSPIAHDPDGVSLFDLLEDKQRYGAKMMNVAGEIVMADLNGMWIYRGKGFRSNQDFSFKFGKWIQYDGDKALSDAAQPLQMKQISQGAKYVIDWLDIAAQKAAGTPDIQQGQAQKGADTLGENQLLASSSMNRYSLTAKIYGWSEAEFWAQSYRIYKEYFSKGLGKKIARLEGPFGTKFKEIAPSDIIMGNELGPDIEIESRKISEAKKARELNQIGVVGPLVLQDPQADQMYFKRKALKLVWPKDEVERMLPLTVDEVLAREENDKLSDEEYVKVKVSDNHTVHLREHASAKDNPTTREHIKAHYFMLTQKRLLQGSPMASIFPTMPEEQMAGAAQNGNSPMGGQNPAPKAPETSMQPQMQ